MKMLRNVVFTALALGLMAAQPQAASRIEECDLNIGAEEGGCPAMWDFISDYTDGGTETCSGYCQAMEVCVGTQFYCYVQDWDCEPFPGPSAFWYCDCICMYR